jgi:hypothetical protein
VIFTGAGGGYVYFFQDKKISRIEKERTQLRTQLGDVGNLYDRLATVQTQVETLNRSWSLRPKTLPATEVASTTNVYINDILAMSPELDVNVVTNEKIDLEGCGYVRYHLAGMGPFHSLARMLQYLEHGPRLMKVRNVDIREVHKVDDKLGAIVHTVQFDVDLLAYFSTQAPFADSCAVLPLPQTTFAAITYNPFQSLVNPEIPPNVYDLPDVEKSTLLAVMKGRAFISDQHGQLVMINEGDEVYLGYVSKIMPERRQVLFLLNKGGIIERFMLTLRFQNKIDEPKTSR